MSEAILEQSQIEIIEHINAGNFANTINSSVSCMTTIYFSESYWWGNASAIDTSLADAIICICITCPTKQNAIYGVDKTTVTSQDADANFNLKSKYSVISSAWTYTSCFYVYEGRVYDLFNNGDILLTNSHRYIQVSCNTNAFRISPVDSSSGEYYCFSIA